MRLLNFVDDGKIKLGIEKENKIIDVEKIALKYNAHVPITMEEVLNEFRNGASGGHSRN